MELVPPWATPPAVSAVRGQLVVVPTTLSLGLAVLQLRGPAVDRVLPVAVVAAKRDRGDAASPVRLHPLPRAGVDPSLLARPLQPKPFGKLLGGEQPGVRYGLALGELLGAHSSTSSTRPWQRTQVTWPSAWWKRIGLRQLHRVIPTTTLGRVGTSSSGGSNSPSPGSWPLLREAGGRRPATRRRGRPPPRSRTPRSLEGGRAGIAGDVLLDYVAGDAAVAWTIRGHFHPIVTVRPEYAEVMT